MCSQAETAVMKSHSALKCSGTPTSCKYFSSQVCSISCRWLISLVGIPFANTTGLHIMRAKCRAIAASLVTDSFLIYEGKGCFEDVDKKGMRKTYS